MQIFLHTPQNKDGLSGIYRRAFASASELFLVTAFLTDWNKKLKLNSNCKYFRIIIGKDFGITKKAACRSVMKWLPPQRKAQFLVANGISGFHPKALFWKDRNGNAFAVIGSSNLTKAAFETNYEANVFSPIKPPEYEAGKRWLQKIELGSLPVSEDWLKKYVEKTTPPGPGPRKPEGTPSDLLSLDLPTPAGMKKQIDNRRKQLAIAKRNRPGLMRLFRSCAGGKITSDKFYAELPNHWGGDGAGRLQGAGWERQGKSSDFRVLAKSFLKIISTSKSGRDDVVTEEIDRLHRRKVPTRGAFLSEMLCLAFPNEYPVLNRPVHKFLEHAEYRAPRGASEGARYVDLARKLRFSLAQNPEYPAKSIAELDAVIWLEFGEEEG